MRFQWLVLAVFLLALVVDHLVFWRSFERGVTVDAAKARRTLWTKWMLTLWTCSALVLGLWISEGLSLSALGFAMPTGWRLWAPAILIAAFVSLQISAAAKIARLTDKSKLRAQIGSTGLMMPHGASELPAWLGVSVSAGFCEELLFRGFLIWILQPVVGWWIAAIASLALFAAAHAYQGTTGLARSALLGALLTAMVFVTRSLWPAIVLHALLDLVGGWIAWLALREPVAAPRDVQAMGSSRSSG